MAVISYKCPNCGGDLRFHPKSQKFKCEYCFSDFTEEEIEAANPDAKEAEEQSRQSVPVMENQEQSHLEENQAVVYSCPSCGAEIVTDATTAATFCFYCHNPVVFQGNLSGDYRPDKIIPFAIDRKKAEADFLSYVRKKKFVPRDFFCKEQIEKISGVYFPFWMYSCHADGDWNGKGDQVRVFRVGDKEVTETKVYAVSRSAELDFEKLTRNALDKENRQLVEAVQPFNLDAVQDFSMGYLSGFQAEKRNIEKKDIVSDLQQEIKKHGSDMMKSSITGYAALNEQSSSVQIRQDEWKYLMLPVWVLTYKGDDDKIYYYAMNGQNGKVCGVLPTDKKRILFYVMRIFFLIFILLCIGGYFIW